MTTAVIGLALIACAWLAAAFSARQPQAVALDVGISAIRIAMTLVCLSWAQELIGKEIEKRTVFFVLAYPHPRSSYVLGRYLGIITMALISLMLLTTLLIGIVHMASWGYQVPHQLQLGLPLFTNMLLMWLDLCLVTAVAVTIALASTTSLMPLLCGLGFAIAARMIGPMSNYISQGADGDEKLQAQFSPILSKLVWLLPDLDRLDVRIWPLYGAAPDMMTLAWSIVASLTYTGLILSAGILFFNRRDFA
nr:ABC transporter permease subunit [Chitinibacter sp. ZOR0017]